MSLYPQYTFYRGILCLSFLPDMNVTNVIQQAIKLPWPFLRYTGR